MGWVWLGVNLSGLGWALFKKMDPRPTLLETYDSGHSRSLEMIPFNRSRRVSFIHSFL